MPNPVQSFGIRALLGLGLAAGTSSLQPPAWAGSVPEQPGQIATLLSQALSPAEQANADFRDKLSGKQLLDALRQGGHVIYIRHATTTIDYADQADPKMRLNDCSTQRQLSLEGFKEAMQIRDAFQKQGIPVGEVIASQYCRSWQTADIAFGRHRQDARLNFLPFEDYTEAQVAEMKARITPFFTAKPAAGTNTVIVGHDDPFEAATGIYPDPMGIAYVITPDGRGGFTLQANVLPAEWAQL
jgi:phosphohistidine phosphatase SixA